MQKKNYDLVFNNKDLIADFDISYSLMVMARSLALNGEIERAMEYYKQCLKSIENIKDVEDKEIVISDLNSGPRYGLV